MDGDHSRLFVVVIGTTELAGQTGGKMGAGQRIYVKLVCSVTKSPQC